MPWLWMRNDWHGTCFNWNASPKEKSVSKTAAALVLSLFLYSASPGLVLARGHGGSSSGRVSVSAYTRADGTHVAAYTRSAPGSSRGYMSGGDGYSSGPSENDVNWSEGLEGPKAKQVPKAMPCVYKDVMSDADLDACR